MNPGEGDMTLHRSLQRRLLKLEDRVGGTSSITEARAVVKFGIEHGMLPETTDIEELAEHLVKQRFSMRKILKKVDGRSRGKLPTK